jgi:hypothetical protein
MKQIRLFGTFASALALLAFPISSNALSYQLGGGSVSANQDSGLLISTAVLPSVTGLSFNLNDGQSYTLPFFNIWTVESDVGSDDRVPQPIAATLNFIIPNISGTVGGETVGVSSLWGIIQYGRVTWNGPVVVNTGGYSFEIALSDETFSPGIFGLTECLYATVDATITQLGPDGGQTRVPDGGATALLLGGALSALAIFRRRF